MVRHRDRRRRRRGRSPRPLPPERTPRNLPQIRPPTRRCGLGLLRFRHRRRAGHPAPRSRGARRSVRLQLCRARKAGHVAGAAGRRGEGPHRTRRPVGDPLPDARKPDRRNGRPDPRPCGGEHLDARRQGALQIGRRTAHLPPRQHRRRPPDGGLARHPRRGVASFTAAALPAIQGIRMDGDAARVRPPAPAAQTHGRRQALETRRRQDGLPRIPALLDLPDGRNGPRLPRGRLFPRSVHQHAGAAGLEPRHRAGDLLDAEADRQLLAGARLEIGCPVPARQSQMVQRPVYAPQERRRAGCAVPAHPARPRHRSRGRGRRPGRRHHEGARHVHHRPLGPHVVLLHGAGRIRGETDPEVLEGPKPRNPARAARRTGLD